MNNAREIEWATYGQTVAHPLVLILIFVLCVVMFRANRAQAVLPLMIVTAMVTHVQRIVILDLDFSMQRIVVMAGLVRIFAKGEFKSLRFITLDKVVVMWVLSSIIMGVVRTPSMSTFINRLGFGVDSLGMYLVVRSCIRTPDDLRVALRLFAWVLLPVALEMCYERLVGRNLFHFMGAVDHVFNWGGRLRCQGAMNHPILAGSFGATAVPLMIGLALSDKRSRLLGGVGAVSGFLIMLTASSSGPAVCFLAGLAAWGLWYFRSWLRWILYGIVAVLAVIHVIREKPVWHLIGRLSDLIGGSGYHRVRLIDATIRNFDKWWLAGSTDSANWGWGLQDTTNWYVSNGLQGGLVTLGLFVAMLVVSFRTVGRGRRMSRRTAAHFEFSPRALEFLAWGLGASLVAHCLAWLSVSYFGTMKLMFFLELAFFAALVPHLGRRRSREAQIARDRGSSTTPATEESVGSMARAPGLSRLLTPLTPEASRTDR